ncbi:MULTISPECIES: hypothetical protein [Microcystis]|jgi:hypothetical protein|uniref:Beta/gamma crystallin 'Greek key' domain-containing protein n=2 Tax=Microcystis TaxID=1125 RepID=B0JRC8_MICAN|nr:MULTISPECIES: hypothetical protein [Microcystis]BAF99972.1 hypothetical protein MAE_01510 [Microcystis aeruginosa NIES-843]BBH41054.1 hypothetical protein myaer102_36430 [Microcystis viridis NIES-102]
MAKLNQVIGAILTEITKAQATSDAYLRDLKASYRENPFLKLLSVPRIEVRDVTVDLKFAILTGEALPSGKVVIYADGSYQGASQELAEGNYDINDLTIGNDTLSSLKIPQGIKVTVYEHRGFSGRSKVFVEDTPWVGDDFNDLTSSIKVEKISIDSMDIEVNTDYLEKLSETAISSISIQLDVAST